MGGHDGGHDGDEEILKVWDRNDLDGSDASLASAMKAMQEEMEEKKKKNSKLNERFFDRRNTLRNNP